MKVKIGVSVRHVHICEKDFKYLFGEDATLTFKCDLSQKGDFSCEQSKTDSYLLGINPPIRDSGDLDGSEKITLCHKDKHLNLNEGCIIANRHIHMSERDSFKLGYYNNQKVKVKIKGEKSAILENVSIKVKDNYSLELHIDTDDANATLVNNGDICEVIENE